MLTIMNLALDALPILTLCTLPLGGLRSKCTLRLTLFGAALSVLAALFSLATGYEGHPLYLGVALLFALYYLHVSYLRPVNALFFFFTALHFITFCTSVSNVLEFLWIGDSVPYLTFEVTVSYFLVQLLLLPVIYFLLKTQFLPIFSQADALEPSWLLFCLPLTQLINCVLLSELYAVKDLPLSATYLLIITISYFGTLISYLLYARIINESTKAARLAERLENIDLLMDKQKEQYQEQTRNYERLRTLRHDLKYQLAVLRTSLDCGDIERMRSYLDQWQTDVETTASVQYSTHAAVNTMVQAMISSRPLTGIRLQINLPLRDCGVEATDLCVLVGNSLQNALDACATVPEGERFIDMSASMKNGQLSLLVRNSFDGVARDDNGTLLSRKRQYARGGIGLTSIRAIVERYMGVMKIDYAGKVFTLMLYLQPNAPRMNAQDKRRP